MASTAKEAVSGTWVRVRVRVRVTLASTKEAAISGTPASVAMPPAAAICVLMSPDWPQKPTKILVAVALGERNFSATCHTHSAAM